MAEQTEERDVLVVGKDQENFHGKQKTPEFSEFQNTDTGSRNVCGKTLGMLLCCCHAPFDRVAMAIITAAKTNHRHGDHRVLLVLSGIFFCWGVDPRTGP